VPFEVAQAIAGPYRPRSLTEPGMTMVTGLIFRFADAPAANHPPPRRPPLPSRRCAKRMGRLISDFYVVGTNRCAVVRIRCDPSGWEPASAGAFSLGIDRVETRARSAVRAAVPAAVELIDKTERTVGHVSIGTRRAAAIRKGIRYFR
jgi:hypothetical protein